MGMVKRSGSDPKFRGKAAETIRMLKCVDWLLDHVFQPDSDHTTLRQQYVQQIALFYKEFYQWDPTTSPAQMATMGRTHVTLYLQLTREHAHIADALSYVPWKFYPKHHLFVHLVECGLNPRDWWAYLDESSIGEGVCLAESNHARYICRNVIEKYRL